MLIWERCWSQADLQEDLGETFRFCRHQMRVLKSYKLLLAVSSFTIPAKAIRTLWVRQAICSRRLDILTTSNPDSLASIWNNANSILIVDSRVTGIDRNRKKRKEKKKNTCRANDRYVNIRDSRSYSEEPLSWSRYVLIWIPIREDNTRFRNALPTSVTGSERLLFAKVKKVPRGNRRFSRWDSSLAIDVHEIDRVKDTKREREREREGGERVEGHENGGREIGEKIRGEESLPRNQKTNDSQGGPR